MVALKRTLQCVARAVEMPAKPESAAGISSRPGEENDATVPLHRSAAVYTQIDIQIIDLCVCVINLPVRDVFCDFGCGWMGRLCVYGHGCFFEFQTL